MNYETNYFQIKQQREKKNKLYKSLTINTKAFIITKGPKMCE